MTYLKLTNLAKIYNFKENFKAVNDLNLSLDEGEIVSFLGSSGCGKTTTLRMIAGLETVTSGTIFLKGRVLNNLHPSKRGVAMAFENYSLYPPLNVQENILFGSKHQYKNQESELKNSFDELIDILEIRSILNKRPAQISSGEQQRVGLGRALLRKADLYVLDEPFSQLGVKLRQRLSRHLKKYLKTKNKTVILITHDQAEALSMSDKVAVMERGVLHQFGTQTDIIHCPRTIFVASFIGEPAMNIFDIKDKSLFNLKIKKKVDSFGIKPVDIQINKGSVLAEVVFVQWLGDQIHVKLKIKDTTFMIAITDMSINLKNGQKMSVSFPQDKIHYFLNNKNILK